MSLSPKEHLALAKKLNIIAYFLSAFVFLLVVMMRRIKLDLGIDFSFLPGVYSTLNAITAILLVIAFIYIRKKQMAKHKLFMILSVSASIIFLLLYVLYHITTPETSFCKEGFIRLIYFFLLITHIILAAVILPFILLTLIKAITNQYDRHKKMARWVFPLWLYVAITGPIIYLLLFPCYS